MSAYATAINLGNDTNEDRKLSDQQKPTTRGRAMKVRAGNSQTLYENGNEKKRIGGKKKMP